MPWMETSPVEQRERFICDHWLAPYTVAGLCARYSISRKTGYKWLERFEDAGRQGLRDRSRAPHRCPHRITGEVAAMICAARRQHPSWGPAKLVAWLRPRHPTVDWPAISAAGDLLARRGLVKKRGPFAPPTTSPSPRPGFMASRSSTCGGCAWAFSTNASCPAPSASRRLPTASGLFISAACCSDASTNATTSSERNHHVLPMFPVSSATYLPGCSWLRRA